ncbi:MAG: Xanthine and CO dehydrogenases maturation factor, XdhC/CoxF family [uncultured Thermomicrobiales bacterium]|uniref:Xanthine and CO dehydrogenases maturation factor, XdhC/CoxF family n=1 Tax=uncultured Thermomicrobiales bacterium TaxID=1645740 RepID=A0A6J4U3F3_9BACT|nr:MAG: Xanthine and CO dehydrogenases maturation factor, XdhC/CoxF family [uncultured Thermomicrobiales bacterium]
MNDLFDEIDAWRAAGDRVAVATVVKVEGSAPRPVGAAMAVTDKGELAGSVSGGCVESAVAAEAEEVLRTGAPKLLRYGITDDMAWDVGLACGGTIEVFVEALDPPIPDR